jgi:hypothetical protein
LLKPGPPGRCDIDLAIQQRAMPGARRPLAHSEHDAMGTVLDDIAFNALEGHRRLRSRVTAEPVKRQPRGRFSRTFSAKSTRNTAIANRISLVIVIGESPFKGTYQQYCVSRELG